MSRSIEPRKVWIVGASSGIGREIARALDRDGHALAVSARRKERLLALVEELAGGGERHAAVPLDVAAPASVERGVEEAERRLGGIDTLIYTAGVARIVTVEETSESLWQETLDANLTGLYRCARALLPRFRRNGQGHLVAVLSISARHGFPGWGAYTAAKFGALGLLDSLREEVRGQGIHVTAVLPGATDTPIWDELGSQWDRARMMRPAQVAAVVASVLRETESGMIEEVRVQPVRGAL